MLAVAENVEILLKDFVLTVRSTTTFSCIGDGCWPGEERPHGVTVGGYRARGETINESRSDVRQRGEEERPSLLELPFLELPVTRSRIM